MNENEDKVDENTQDEVAEETANTESSAPESDTKAAKEESPQEKIEQLEKENKDLKDQLLRRAADFDNYRKRMLKEKQDTYDYANANLLKDLLESLDNFDRTIAASEKTGDAKSIADGIKMINKSLVSMLENKYNLVGYGAQGDNFNPDEHEAIGSEEGEVSSPVLKEVYLKGYKLKDRVIRAAKVMVTMPNSSSNKAKEENTASSTPAESTTENNGAENSETTDSSK